MEKNLVINPNKLSQPAGAALAFLGVKGMAPLWHGVQGCTAFAKVLFISHFREPMPFVNTAISQTNVIMGSDENIIEALNNIRDKAEIVGLITTGVAETSGTDLNTVVKSYEKDYPGLKLVYLNTPDYEGNLCTGYTRATKTLLKTIVKPRKKTNKEKLALFPGPYITPGEVEYLREIVKDFGLDPVFCPDLGDSLFGYLHDKRFNPSSSGGVDVQDIETLSEAVIAISVGSSMESVADEFGKLHDVPVEHYNNLSVLDEIDPFFQTLVRLSGRKVPSKYLKQRQHYQDTLLDTDFYFHDRSVAIAGDVEFVKKWKAPLDMLEVKTTGIANEPEIEMDVGDYSDLANRLIEQEIDFVIGNSHVARLAEEMKIPVIRSGIPVTDRMGEPQSVRIGYLGASRLLMECANAIVQVQHHQRPYVSDLTATLL